MSPIGILRRLIRVAAWLHPHIQAWNKNRTKNRRDADAHRQAHNYGEAEKSLLLVLEEAIKRKQANWKIGGIRLELASVQLELGKFDEADTNAKEALAAFGRPATPYLDVQARICTAQGKHSESQAFLRQAIQREDVPVKPDLRLLGRLHQDLAESLIVTGDLEEAEKLQTEALSLLEQLPTATAVSVANARWLLGDIYRRQSKFQLAIVCFEQSLDQYRKSEVPDSPLITRGLNSLAEAAVETGDIERAAREYERTLTLMDRQLGSKPEDRAAVLLNLARIYEGSGLFAKAQEITHEAISLNERGRGPQLALSLELMGRLYLRTGRYAEGLPRFERAQKVWVELGPNYQEQLDANLEQQDAIREELARVEEARRSAAADTGSASA